MAWQLSDWFTSSRLDTFEYIEVDKDTMQDIRVLDTIEETGGTIHYQDLTTIKVTADLPFVGDFDVGNNYIRIYSISELAGESIKILHGTFMPSRPETEYSSASATGTIDCYSLLQLAKEQTLDQPLCIEQGQLAVTKAESLLREVGLNVISDGSLHILSSARNYDAGISYIEVVNDLLSLAAFNSVDIDARGNAQLIAYTDPTNRTPLYTLRDDVNDVNFSPVMKHNFNTFDVPNKVIAVYAPADDESMPMQAIAINSDPQSRYSTVSRGRVVPHVEEVNEVDSQEALQEIADRVLIDKSSAVESVELEHSFIPYNMGDALKIFYTHHNINFTGVAVSKDLSLTRGMRCSTRIRRFVRM